MFINVKLGHDFKFQLDFDLEVVSSTYYSQKKKIVLHIEDLRK